MGLWEVEVAGHRAYRHTGFWGTSATWVPDLDLVVALTVNQHDAKEVLDGIPEEVARLVAGLPGTGEARRAKPEPRRPG
jgi:CubicO group peptidase (beta-lactamase class C family)